MSQKEIVERARIFANRPTPAAWVRLVGEAGILSAPAAEPEAIGPYLKRVGTSKPQLPAHIKRSAEFLQAAFSDIAHQRQTVTQVEAWEQTARRLTPTPSRTIHTKPVHVREAIQWAAPLEVLDLPGGDASGNWCLVTVDAEALLATILCWLLNPDLKFGLHECGRSQQCEIERFHYRNRKFCDPICMRQVNKSTNSERSRKRRVIAKITSLLKPHFPVKANEMARAVYKPGTSAEQLAAIARANTSRSSR